MGYLYLFLFYVAHVCVMQTSWGDAVPAEGGWDAAGDHRHHGQSLDPGGLGGWRGTEAALSSSADSECTPGARFTKYLTTILRWRQCYDQLTKHVEFTKRLAKNARLCLSRICLQNREIVGDTHTSLMALFTLINKMVKINCRVRIMKYWLVIDFWKNDDSFSVYDVIVTSL